MVYGNIYFVSIQAGSMELFILYQFRQGLWNYLFCINSSRFYGTIYFASIQAGSDTK
jgi:hypothetical protein